MSILRLGLAVMLTASGVFGAKAKAPEAAARTSLHVVFWAENDAPVQAKVNGTEVKVLRQLGPTDPLMVLLVLDLAGDLTYADPARQAIVEGLGKLPASTWVALLRAQDGLRVLTDPMNDRQPAIDVIQGLGISGRAGLLDTIETASELGDDLQTRTAVRAAVLYITDSSISNYREDYTNPVVNSSDGRDMSRRFPEGLVKEKIRQLETRLGVRETPVFIVHLHHQSDQLNEAYQTGLLALATATGATAEVCRSLAEIPFAVHRVLEQIQNMRSVTIGLPAGAQRQYDIELIANDRQVRHRGRFLTKRK